MSHDRDRELGMHCSITRRDFLNGFALGTAGALTAPRWLYGLDLGEAGGGGEYYPPALTGLRGSHVGSFEVAHSLRDGTFWKTAGEPEDTGESYDLVVVGGGLSGLSAAHFFRKETGGRVLILENHDDFGGHAKRNEFTQAGGPLRLGFGGTWSIDSAGPYSALAQSLITELGIDVTRWKQVMDPKVYGSLGLGRGFFFDKETFGADRLLPDPAHFGGGEEGEIAGRANDPWPAFVAAAPLSEAARRDLPRVFKDRLDPWPELSSDQKKARLARMSYADFLTKVMGYSPDVLPFFQARPQGLFGVGIDAVPAQDAWGFHYPGFQGMKLEWTPGPGMNLDSYVYPKKEPYFFHFPDGNASVARLLVRGLIPDAIPGSTADDVVTAHAHYAKLDEAGSPARIRLRSTVVRVRHLGEVPKAEEVEIAYVQDGAFRKVRARHAILACWNVVIPYICPELPAGQREALAYAIKVPLLYTNVLVRSWTPWVKLKVQSIHAPGGYHTSANLDMPVSIGGYECTKSPEEPILIHLMKAPCQPGLPIKEQHLAGRMQIFTTSFEDYEREIRSQLARMLGPGGFDPAADIAAITVNRWPHGYAYQYNSLADPFWFENTEPPCVRARQPYGRLAIANSDAGAYAYTDCAIDEAYRAVQEILPRRG